MLVFIDESGDPGFNMEAGSSPIFVVAMVIFDDAQAAAATQAAIEESDARRVHKGEFKFNKCANDIRDRFFMGVRNSPFRVRAIVVRKDIIRLIADKDRFYEFFVKTMLQHDNKVLFNATVVIDGSGDRLFRRNLNAALRRRLDRGALKEVRFKDSKSDHLVQLADMCAGAIARSYSDKKNKARWRHMLGARLNDVWDFR
jgi:hypothetical protein